MFLTRSGQDELYTYATWTGRLTEPPTLTFAGAEFAEAHLNARNGKKKGFYRNYSLPRANV